MRSTIQLFLKGLAMGSADVVPGVSGGTIAFISGIYETLLASISAFNFSLIKTFKTDGFAGVWKAVNGSFLLPLFAGIATAIVTLAKTVTYLMDTQPIGIWSFFFGLVLASILLVVQMVKKWTFKVLLWGGLGIGIAYKITLLTPASTEELSLIYLFFCGVIAICAMILPGISGSFILVLLGAYRYVLDSLHERNWAVIVTFSVGCFLGITSFSHLLKWLFAKFHDVTVACLAGFMLGSLAKVWPWRDTVIDQPITPETFVKMGGDPQFALALALMVFGGLLVLGLEAIGRKKAS